MFYSISFVILQNGLYKMTVFLPKILSFRKFVVILYPIKFASMGNWHKICKEISKKQQNNLFN